MLSTSAQTAQPTVAVATERRIRAVNVISLVALAAVVISGAWLRFHLIAAKSFWTDEGISAAFTRLGWYDFARILWRREANMTLYYLLLRAWTHVGDSVRMIRGLSAAFSVATIPAIYAIGKRLSGTGVGLTAAVLLAINAYAVRYAQEARSYSLVAFLVTLATYFLIRAVEENRRRDWTWYIATSVLAVYAHFFAVLVVVAHWVSLRIVPLTTQAQSGAPQHSNALEGINRAMKWIVLCTLPIWIFIAATGAGPIKWIPRPGAHDIYTFLLQFTGNGGTPLLCLYMVPAVLALVAAARRWRSRPIMLENWQYALPLCWFVVPVGITLAASLLRPAFLPRYMNVCLPALVLLVAIGLMSFRERWMALPVMALICWFAVVGLRGYYERDFDISREDYRGAATYVVEHSRPGDAILFAKGQGRFAYDYYAARAPHAATLPTVLFPAHGDRVAWRDFMGNMTPQMFSELAPRQGRIWLVLSPDMPYADERFMAAVATTHTVVEAHGVPFLRIYLLDPK